MVNLKIATNLSMLAKLSLFVLTLFAFSAIMSNLYASHAAGVVAVSTQPATVNVTAGNVFNVSVSLNPNGNQVSAAEVHAGYDATMLEGQSITAGSLLPVVLSGGTIGNGTSQIIVGAQPGAPTTTTGTIATLTFRALKSGTTSINLNNTQTASIGISGNTVGTLTGSTVNIAGVPTATPVPTQVPTPVPTQAPTPTPGPTQAPNIVSLNITPATLSTTVGNTVSLSLNLDTSSDQVSAAEVHLNFDQTKLQAQSFTAGSFLPVVLAGATFDNVLGTASITLGSQPGTPVTGLGSIATINFRALASGIASVGYGVTTQTASVGKAGNSVSSLSGSDITIGASPTPIATPTPSPVPSPTPNVDTTAPVVTITSPSQGAIVLKSSKNQPSVVQIRANATDNKGVSKVLFYVNGSRKCTDNTSPYSCDWKVPSSKGSKVYTISVVAFDAAGNSGTSSITVLTN